MLKDVAANYAIDERKNFAVGYSMGSMFGYELACQMSGRFIAISHAGPCRLILGTVIQPAMFRLCTCTG
ncbi:MAG: hypothetical protein CM15mP120_09640 [Pseudomonadota bacterium]|nr:MAG: hypothetical protein CM15mP120_09640 [Pseudomonadota bacterium]